MAKPRTETRLAIVEVTPAGARAARHTLRVGADVQASADRAAMLREAYAAKADEGTEVVIETFEHTVAS